jgi:hypothetical protein
MFLKLGPVLFVPWAATGMASIKVSAIVIVVIARFILYS